jgi:glycosyltransferase involved in cell wall biosynthesis
VPPILLLAHQLDYSGAPLALFRLAEALREFKKTVHLRSLQNGPLAAAFYELGVRQYQPSMLGKYQFVVSNTLLTTQEGLTIAENPEKLVAWIHESKDFFSMYGRDISRFPLQFVRKAMFPSRYLLDEYADVMPQAEKWHIRNYVSLDGIKREKKISDYYCVMGQWEKRKNQETLLRLIEPVNTQAKLLFVGSERPNNIESRNYQFTGTVSPTNAKRLLAKSQGFISASISETQNLGAIEAILLDRPVLLSSIKAHQELKSLIPSVNLFDVDDIDSFSAGYTSLNSQMGDKRLLERSRRLALQFFGKEAFLNATKELLGRFNMW